MAVSLIALFHVRRPADPPSLHSYQPYSCRKSASDLNQPLGGWHQSLRGFQQPGPQITTSWADIAHIDTR